MFTSFVAISPAPNKVGGKAAERVPGISPSMKDGLWNERASAPTGVNSPYPLIAALNAVVVP
jgi:hypothetical protein